jgi:hypothetical protein
MRISSIVFLLVLVASVFGQTTSGTALDLTRLPKHPGPWRVQGSMLLDGEGKRLSAAGANTAGYANLPVSSAEANAWTLQGYRLGIRFIRPHHIDVALTENFVAHKPRLDHYISSWKKRGVPAILDLNSQLCDVKKLYDGDPLEWAKWESYARRLLAHVPTLSNLKPYAIEPYIVGICPANEDAYFAGIDEQRYVAMLSRQIAFVRALGYRGLIWGANAGIPAGWTIPGDLECWHRYTDHPWGTTFWDTLEAEQPWNQYQRRTAKPLICTEFGSLWPAPMRGENEKAIIDHGISIGAQAMAIFALATQHGHWTKAGSFDQYAMIYDPARLNSLRYLAMALNDGVPAELVYQPGGAFASGFEQTAVDPWTRKILSAGELPLVETVFPVEIQVPAGKSAWALDSMTGKRLYRLPIEVRNGIRYALPRTPWTEIVPP